MNIGPIWRAMLRNKAGFVNHSGASEQRGPP
jgi:hypothetical protein